MANTDQVESRPIRTLFCVTSMPVGGAETLLMNLVRRLDRRLVAPQIACLKERGPLGELLADELPVHANLLGGKWDLRILPRLTSLLRRERIDAIVTVGAGDKMFWGRLAARLAGVRVVCSALHSTGWPDGVGKLNRCLTPITDAFIGVARAHGEHLRDCERFPAEKVVVIPNGVDTARFAPTVARESIRRQLGIGPTTPVVGILAALRPEKNHELFLEVASRIRKTVADANFVIIGDGPRRAPLEARCRELNLSDCVHFLGSRSDVAELLGAIDVLTLTSHNEASPVSILESLSCGTPVVSVDVGSIRESIDHGATGYLTRPGDAAGLTEHLAKLLDEPVLRAEMGARGRQFVVGRASLEVMVEGYEQLLTRLYGRKTGRINPTTQPASRPVTSDALSQVR